MDKTRLEKGKQFAADTKTADSGRAARRPSVLILVNHEVVIYNFRLELVERLLKEGKEVHISTPHG